MGFKNNYKNIRGGKVNEIKNQINSKVILTTILMVLNLGVGQI